MGRNFQSRASFFVSAPLAVFLIISLLVAPVCASRCAAALCVPAAQNHGEEVCHQPSMPVSDAPVLADASHHPCATGELFYIAPRSESLSATLAWYALPSASPLPVVPPQLSREAAVFALARSPLSELSVFPPLRL